MTNYMVTKSTYKNTEGTKFSSAFSSPYVFALRLPVILFCAFCVLLCAFCDLKEETK